MKSKVRTHRDLDVWREGIALVVEVYKLLKVFPREERYGLVDQIKRAAVSIPSNIAEGAARKSPKEFMQFLYIALGSAAELETQLVISKKLSFLAEEEILEKLERLKSKLLGLIRSLRDKSYVR